MHIIKRCFGVVLAVLASSCVAMDVPQPGAGNKIAILGWGSLIHCPGNLKANLRGFENFRAGGPGLYVQYSRVSGMSSEDTKFLSLAITNGVKGKEIPVYYAISHGTLSDAITALEKREGLGSNYKKYIGMINLTDNTFRHVDDETDQIISGRIDQSRYFQDNAMLQRIRAWAETNGIDAVIWTDLPPTYKKQTFTYDAQKEFLDTLNQKALLRSYAYFQITPSEIRAATKNGSGNKLMEHVKMRLGAILNGRDSNGKRYAEYMTADWARLYNKGKPCDQ
jgi:hypothetical protein